MVEEGRGDMDKKISNRPWSVTSKSNVTDIKKDGAGSRNQRRRRDNNGQCRPNYDNQGPSRRPFPQKYKGQDKRPPARRFEGDNGASNEVAYDAEAGSFVRPGSKKGSLNHLLNFSYAPRESSDGYYGSSPPNWKGRGARYGHGRVKYSKEQFLQANCQFIVKEGEDYSMHLAEADKLVDWERIEQVRILSSEVPSCPICLYPPVAAKITRCGHIYCWSCILHYLSLAEKKTWSRCPICYESVESHHLKSVKSTECQGYNVGDEITLTLMKREKGTTVAMPAVSWEPVDGQCYNVGDETKCTQFSKLLVAPHEQVQSIIDAEREELRQQLSEEEANSFESSIIGVAMDNLNEREAELKKKKTIKKIVDRATRKSSSEEEESSPPPTVVETEAKECLTYKSAFEGELEDVTPVQENLPELPTPPSTPGAVETLPSPPPTTPGAEETSPSPPPTTPGAAEEAPPSPTDEMPAEVAAEELAMPVEAARETGKPSSNAFYFYQASDGQHIYMQSVNARCLVKEYGSFQNCPPTVTGKIVELESVTMSPELRGRVRYLNHLPLTCEFKVAELVLKPPVVSKETLECFMGEIERRRKQRQRKNREEKKRSKKIQEEEDKKIGIYHKNVLKIKSEMHFPECGKPSTRVPGEEVTPTSSTVSTPYGSPEVALLEQSPSSLDGQDDGSLSFAKMLRQGKQVPPSAWGSAVSEKVPVVVNSTAYPHSDQSDGEQEKAPAYQESFGNAIQDCLDRFNTSGDAECEVKPMTGGKKKKKKGKALLFSTSMNRR